MKNITDAICRIGRMLALAGFAAALITAPASATDAPDREAIKSLVREVLNENPELLLDALHRLQQRLEAEQAQEKIANLERYRSELERDPSTFVAGNPDGDITVVEFFDYRCGFCKKARPVVEQLVAKDGRIRLALKEFPILGPNSEVASKAAIAAMDQGKYAPFHKALMDAKGALTESRVMRVAEQHGLDISRLRQDMESSRVRDIIRKNRELAAKLGISGTPAFVIGDRIIPGVTDLAQMQQLVADAREKCLTCRGRKTGR